jgi:hypothetical protein
MVDFKYTSTIGLNIQHEQPVFSVTKEQAAAIKDRAKESE